MVDGHITFNGIESSSYGIYVANTDDYNAPHRAYEHIIIPGRNGDLLYDDRRYSNVDINYQCFVIRNLEDSLEAIHDWLMSPVGYQRLEDSYHLDEYRMAICDEDFIANVKYDAKMGKFNLLFHCKPQRYLKTGEKPIVFEEDGVIVNPTKMDALPFIKVHGYGIISIGNTTLTIAQHTQEFIDIDCELQEAYSGTTNMNAYVTLSSGEFPKLISGPNAISIADTITDIVITPRWWRL